MPDRLELDLESIPPTYKGNYLIHSLAVPAEEFDSVVEERAQAEHGHALHDLSPVDIDHVRHASETDTRQWAHKRQYHVANCPGCIGRKRGVGKVPED